MLITVIIVLAVFMVIFLGAVFVLEFENSSLKQKIENKDELIQHLNDEIAQCKKEIIDIYSEQF